MIADLRSKMFTVSSLKPWLQRRHRIDKLASLQTRSSDEDSTTQPCLCRCECSQVGHTDGRRGSVSRSMSVASAYQRQSEKTHNPYSRAELPADDGSVASLKLSQSIRRRPKALDVDARRLRAGVAVLGYPSTQIFDDEKQVSHSMGRLLSTGIDRDHSQFDMSSLDTYLHGTEPEKSFFELSSSSDADSDLDRFENSASKDLRLKPSPLRPRRTDRLSNHVPPIQPEQSTIYPLTQTPRLVESSSRPSTLGMQTIVQQLGTTRSSCISMSVYSRNGSETSDISQDHALLSPHGISTTAIPGMTEDME